GAPAPYDQAGIGGRPIQTVIIDENGGPEQQVSEYRRLVLDQKVDVVIGYISSGDCSAVAPVAEELERLTVFFDCGTNAIFEEIDKNPTYVFRTAAHQIIDSVGAARYVTDKFPDASTVAGINQNYAWGQDSWTAFSAAYRQLNKDATLATPLFPELYAGAYSPEVSTLLRGRPDVIHSSFWGGDLESFIVQSAPRRLPEQSTLVLTAADPLLPRLGEQVPSGLVVGARGPHGPFAPDNELNRWFKDVYQDVGVRPVYPAYHMAQAILGVKAAWEKAKADAGREPTPDQVIKAFEGLEFDTPSGMIRMALGKGHQAVEPIAYGTTGEFDENTGEVAIEDIEEYPAECVNPPAGTPSTRWIQSGFPEAKC
ncbi:MAG: ABC transporter substrate-binding protein, partial [Haloechinothrix sp.]